MVITKVTLAPAGTGFGEPVLTKLMAVGDCAITETGTISSTLSPSNSARRSKPHCRRRLLRECMSLSLSRWRSVPLRSESVPKTGARQPVARRAAR